MIPIMMVVSIFVLPLREGERMVWFGLVEGKCDVQKVSEKHERVTLFDLLE